MVCQVLLPGIVSVPVHPEPEAGLHQEVLEQQHLRMEAFLALKAAHREVRQHLVAYVGELVRGALVVHEAAEDEKRELGSHHDLILEALVDDQLSAVVMLEAVLMEPFQLAEGLNWAHSTVVGPLE